MSDYRFEFVKRNHLDCLHVMIDSNSLKEIADTHIPLDDILEAATSQGYMTVVPHAEPTPTHDGKLEALGDSPYVAQVEFFDARPPTALLLLSGGYGASVQSAVYFDPKQALSLLAWLTQEREKLEALAKEQVEPDETYIDFAEHLPPADWKQTKEQA